MKKGLDSTRKELHSLESQISKQEFLLGHEGSGDATTGSSQADADVILESETIEILEGGDAQPEGTTCESMADLPEGEVGQPMETEPPVSPVSPTEDDLLSGAAATTTAGVETELASLQVTSSPEGEGGQKEASG